MNFNKENIEILSKHVTLAHHIKGRVRFKIDPKIQNYSEKIDLDGLGKLEEKINGIKNVSLNKLAKSLTIEYDHKIISHETWEELANSDNYEEIAIKLNNLLKED